MTNKAFSIHGHFYQPPREDPLTSHIPKEPGASPYDNWNERIYQECYRPNIELNNFERISFNVGPTLFSWIGSFHQNSYQQILAQDRINLNKHGVGNAIAQAYNHTILPLSSPSEKAIQIHWGVIDFTHRFERPPQGMWLPETAVDYETLAIMAHQGIEFTILAPWQADAEELDPTEPYRVLLPGGDSITVFFYERELSAKISFDQETSASAEMFAKRDLLPSYVTNNGKSVEDQFYLIASDGELYGHHQPNREQFLFDLLNGAGAASGLTPSIPALWLKLHPPRKTVRIREGTSWSCHHGVTRWKGKCACTTTDGRWKSNLRSALDRLATTLDGLYFETIYPLIPKPRLLLQRYIHVILGEMQVEQLIAEITSRPLTNEQQSRISLLLESQRERQRMFTSCGWFFDDFDRIEPRNVILYAAQAVHLAHLATGIDLSNRTAIDLKQVVSPRTGLSADKVFNQHLERTKLFKGRHSRLD
jgi:hypothetical protein